MNSPISFTSCRRFGVEIELNNSDGILKRMNPSTQEIPAGADNVALIVKKASDGRVEIACHDYVHNNDNWVIKHDMSCGIEINTPVFKGWFGLKKLIEVIDALSKENVSADKLCSLHVHVGTDDLDNYQIASVIAHYIKCEHVFFDSIPYYRKNNRYCQLIGMTDWFDLDFDMSSYNDIIEGVSRTKYGSINAYHYVHGGGFDLSESRNAIEFRIAENTACLDAYFVKNWVRLLVHFVEVIKDLDVPVNYNKGDPKTGLAWLDFKDVYSLLRFDERLTNGMQQVRQWFMDRINMNMNDYDCGIWSVEGRKVNRSQFDEIYEKLPRINDVENGLYGKDWIS